MATPAEDVYATLLLNDAYIPGAMVLAHSLKDAGTKKKLAVLVTTDSVSADSMAELQKLYDFVIPVERIVNNVPTNLYLMDRVDLHSAFTKITLWKQEQFRKIVYMDADMVALRAPDELFNLAEPFSAAPDIGWPDLFNSGLMVLSPNMGDFYALDAMAKRGISFDGADQGLLNMHFKHTYNRLSFTYNVTPSAHYQYLPAYRHFQSNISAAHFIGKDKPWTSGRSAHSGSDPYSELSGRWWAVYDKHYRDSAPYIIQYHVKGEFQPPTYSRISSTTGLPSSDREQSNNDLRTSQPEGGKAAGPSAAAEKKAFLAPSASWDAARAPPPADSKPEASNLPATHYQMSNDKTPFKAPERYPEPPKNMYYEVPQAPTYQKPAPIFPWETGVQKPTRVFADDNEDTLESGSNPTDDGSDVPATPVTPTIKLTPADPWQTFSNRNAWDEIPEIEQYIGALQKNRKGNIQVLSRGSGFGGGFGGNPQVSSPTRTGPSMRLTDFPTELERPSLPVTPAPIRRPSFWGDERDDEGELPAAEGVPAQADWDPSAQLEALARRQSDVLARKLSNSDIKEIPTRPLPYGSEGVKSPTYVPQERPSAWKSHTSTNASSSGMAEPSYKGPGAEFDKDAYPTYETPMPPSEEEKDVLMT